LVSLSLSLHDALPFFGAGFNAHPEIWMGQGDFSCPIGSNKIALHPIFKAVPGGNPAFVSRDNVASRLSVPADGIGNAVVFNPDSRVSKSEGACNIRANEVPLHSIKAPPR